MKRLSGPSDAVPAGGNFMWFAIAAAIIIALFLIFPIIRSGPGRKEIDAIEIGNPDFSKLRDGTFEGKYRGTRDKFRDVTVEIKISSGVLTKIKVKRDALKKGRERENKCEDAAEIVLGRVIEKQSLKVDVISGATLTCKTRLKAVEDALEKAQIKDN